MRQDVNGRYCRISLSSGATIIVEIPMPHMLTSYILQVIRSFSVASELTYSNRLIIHLAWNRVILEGCVNVGLQIEHTLVKAGGRSCIGNELEGPFSCDGNSYLVRLVDKDFFEKCDAIIDYSEQNLTNLALSHHMLGVSSKTYLIHPIPLTEPRFERHNKGSANEFHHVTTDFSEPLSARRAYMIDRLKENGVRTVNHQGFYPDQYYQYKRRKLLLNIHQTDHHHTLEMLRILPAILSGCIVIAEQKSQHELYRNLPNLRFIEYSDILNYTEGDFRHIYESSIVSNDAIVNLFKSLKKSNIQEIKSLINQHVR